MLTQVAYVCHACGFVTAAELYPDPRAADARVKAIRRREAARPVRCARCGGPTRVEGRPVVQRR